MKSVYAVLALAFVGTVAQAKPSILNKDKTPRAAVLDLINLGESHLGEAVGGEVTVDVPRKVATLRIELAFNCPAGQFCSQAMPAPIQAQLPIVSVTYDGCGTKILVAKKDERPVDGALEILTIEDNSQNYCPHFVAMAGTTLVYETQAYDRFTSRPVKSRLTASGPEMAPLAF